jgi:hypothetical protein
MSAGEVERRIGMAPDEVHVKGSRSTDPVRPASHSWAIVCRERGLTVQAQIAKLVARLQPARDAIKELIAKEDVLPVLQVVRGFDDEGGEEENPSPVQGLEKLPGQHQLLGWHLDLQLIDFLADLRVELDADEYG